METILKIVGGTALIFLTAIALGCLMAFPLSWAWNYAVPVVFGLPEIGPMQAFCLSFVFGSLVKPQINNSK